MNKKSVIYLYSASPRRSELLGNVGIEFLCFPVDADETIPDDSTPGESVRIISERKLKSGLEARKTHKRNWGLAGDTLVYGPRGPLGKPENREQAAEMLQSMSGTTHEVYTGIAVYSPDPDFYKGKENIRITHHSTSVTFRKLTEMEITAYLDTGEWEGAAGAYRIQGKGAFLINRIEGLWSTVVGLPLSPLYGILTAMSYPFGETPVGRVTNRS